VVRWLPRRKCRRSYRISSSYRSKRSMSQQTRAEEWSRRVRVLDDTEVALLFRNALELRLHGSQFGTKIV
jgi:hypothetical protein